MLETLKNLGKQRVAAIDLQNIYAQVVIASPNITGNGYSQVKLEKLLYLESFIELKRALSTEKLSLVAYLASSSEALVETIPNTISKNNINNHRNDLGVSSESHVSDYFNFNNSCLFCAYPIKSSKSTSQTLSQINSRNIIGQSDLALAHFYLKIYGAKEHSTPSAILTIGSEHASLIVISKQSIIFTGSLKFSNSTSESINSNSLDILDTIKILFCEAKQALPKEQTYIATNSQNSSLDYDLVLATGEVDDNLTDLLKGVLARNQGADVAVGAIEFFNPLLYNYINIDNLTEREKQLIESEGHKFASVIAGVAMALEFAGVDLSINQEELSKNFTKEIYFYSPESYLVKAIEISTYTSAKIKKAVATQTTIMIVALIVAITSLGYSYYQTNEKLHSLDKSISEEKSVLDSLKDVKKQYNEYKAKLDIKQNRINTIQEIQAKQLVVPTIVKVLQTAQFPIRDSLHFSLLEVNGREINIAGNSTDKFKAVDFFKQLGATGAFIDLNPVYDSNDPLKCRYSVTTTYNGPIEANQIKLPIDSDSLFNQINQNQNQLTHLSTSK